MVIPAKVLVMHGGVKISQNAIETINHSCRLHQCPSSYLNLHKFGMHCRGEPPIPCCGTWLTSDAAPMRGVIVGVTGCTVGLPELRPERRRPWPCGLRNRFKLLKSPIIQWTRVELPNSELTWLPHHVFYFFESNCMSTNASIAAYIHLQFFHVGVHMNIHV